MSDDGRDARHYVLAHGWAFNPEVWEPLLDRLGSTSRVTFCGVNFLRHPPQSALEVPDNAICIGFSFGVLWLLLNPPKSMKALISISGFPRLDARRNVEALHALRRGLLKNPAAQVKAFRQLAGVRGDVPGDLLNVPALLEGLTTMLESDGRPALEALDCPVLALASTDDPVIAPDVSRSSWPSSAIRWCASGGHAIPLTQPDWCALEIHEFIRAHAP